MLVPSSAPLCVGDAAGMCAQLETRGRDGFGAGVAVVVKSNCNKAGDVECAFTAFLLGSLNSGSELCS